MSFKRCSIATRTKLGSIYWFILPVLLHGLIHLGCSLNYGDYLTSLQPRRHALILNEQQTWVAEKTGVSHQVLGLGIVKKPSNTEATFSNKSRNNSRQLWNICSKFAVISLKRDGCSSWLEEGYCLLFIYFSFQRYEHMTEQTRTYLK